MSKVIMRKDKLGQLKERIVYDDFNEYCEKNIKFIHSRVNLIYNKYKSGFDRLRLDYDDCFSIACIKLAKAWDKLDYEKSGANTFVSTIVFRELACKLRDNDRVTKVNEFGTDYSTDFILPNDGDSEREDLIGRYIGIDDDYDLGYLRTAIDEIVSCGNQFYNVIHRIILYQLSEGKSCTEIANYLNDHGYKSKQGKKFTRGTVHLRIDYIRNKIKENNLENELKDLLIG